MNTNLLTTNKNWLSYATKKLNAAKINSSSLDAVIILSFCLGVTKIEVLSNPQKVLTEKELRHAENLLDKRLLNYPIAYITKSIEFYNHSFYVDSRVLIPRPESESFINLLKAVNIADLKYLTDLGCGSGVLGISAKLQFPHLKIELLDKSKSALNVADINLIKFGLKSHSKLSNLLSSSNNKFDIIIANLPYVPQKMVVSRAVLFEPKMAVFAENDGLYFYNKMLKQLNDINHRPKYILVECLSQQVSTLTKLLNKLHYKQIRSEGLVHMFLFDSKKIGCQL